MAVECTGRNVEITAIHRRRRWKAQEETADPRAAVALAFEKIDAQAMRDSEKRRDKKQRGGTRFLPKGWRTPASVVPMAASARGVRRVPASVKPMGVNEAALVLESSGQEVLVFRDASNDR